MFKNNRKWSLKVFGLVIVGVTSIALLSGCSEEIVGEKKEPINSVPALKALSGNNLSFEHTVAGSVIETSYDFGDYLLEDWKITNSKSIRMDVGVKKLEKGTEILVDTLHAEVSIKSRTVSLNGMLQDSMDSSYNGTSQDGFFINEQYTYSNIFSVEGFSKDIISGWNFYMGSFGTGRDVNSSILTEKNLFNRGTYGSQLSVFYSFLIKKPGDTKYHMEIIEDRVIIPTALVIKRSNEVKAEKAEQERGTESE